MLCPTVRITMRSDIHTMGGDQCGFCFGRYIHDKIHRHSIIFNSRIRGNLSDHTRYEGKKSHWMVAVVGGASDKGFQYILFSKKKEPEKVSLSLTPIPRPHTDILLHIKSATGMMMAGTRKFACKTSMTRFKRNMIHPKL